MSDTPETDAAIKEQSEWKLPFVSTTMDGVTYDGPLASLCRRMERERDEAREKCAALGKAMSYSPESETLLKRFLQAIKERDEARHESEEQARLLGMSAEREESLRGKLFMLERELLKLKEAAKSVVEVWETPPWKIGETPSNAITQLRDAIGYED